MSSWQGTANRSLCISACVTLVKNVCVCVCVCVCSCMDACMRTCVLCSCSSKNGKCSFTQCILVGQNHNGSIYGTVHVATHTYVQYLSSEDSMSCMKDQMHSQYISVASGEARDKAFLGITLAQLISLCAFPTKLYHLLCSFYLHTQWSAHTKYAMMLGSHTLMHVYQCTMNLYHS